MSGGTILLVEDERAIRPGHHMRMKRVDAAECRLHLSGANEQAAGNCRERDEPLLHLGAPGSERHEEVGACIGIDDGLERRLGLVQLEGR